MPACRTRLYTNHWAVRISGGLPEANRIASKYGYINIGQVTSSGGRPPALVPSFALQPARLTDGRADGRAGKSCKVLVLRQAREREAVGALLAFFPVISCKAGAELREAGSAKGR